MILHVLVFGSLSRYASASPLIGRITHISGRLFVKHKLRLLEHTVLPTRLESDACKAWPRRIIELAKVCDTRQSSFDNYGPVGTITFRVSAKKHVLLILDDLYSKLGMRPRGQSEVHGVGHIFQPEIIQCFDNYGYA